MVALLRPYLFNKRERKKKGKGDGCEVPVKEKKTYTLARRVFNQAFLIVKLEPQRPDEQDSCHSSQADPLPLPLTSPFSGWAALANKAWVDSKSRKYEVRDTSQ